MYRAQVPESAKLAMVSAYVYLQEGNIAEGEQRINLAIRHALLRRGTPHGSSHVSREPGHAPASTYTLLALLFSSVSTGQTAMACENL